MDPRPSILVCLRIRRVLLRIRRPLLLQPSAPRHTDADGEHHAVQHAGGHGVFEDCRANLGEGECNVRKMRLLIIVPWHFCPEPLLCPSSFRQ